MSGEERIHSVPVPERFLPRITQALAEAYAEEGLIGGFDVGMPAKAPSRHNVSSFEWTEEEIIRAYRESTPVQKKILDCLSASPDERVDSLQLGLEVYPELEGSDAEGKVFGSLGGLGTRFSKSYGKIKWFFKADGNPEFVPNSGQGRMLYQMSKDVAEIIR